MKNDILYWSKRLYEKGMSPSISGNVSVRTKEGILISPSGACLNDMEEDDIVMIDKNGNLIKGMRKPSSEKIMHTEIYSRREDINAIIHSHCPLLTAFAVADVPITKPILPDFVCYFDEVPVLPYYCPSSIDLAEAVGDYFEDYDAVLLKNHGIVLGDKDLQSAFYKLELLRTYAEVYFGAQVLGKAHSIPKKDVNEIIQLYRINRRS